MKILKNKVDDILTISLEGRLDTNTSVDLENDVKDLSGVKTLIFDLEKLEYISSSGLRILLACQKRMNMQGNMIIKNMRDEIREVFEITGFNDIMDIE